MSSTQDRLAIPIPKMMRLLDRDRRGYPIPFINLRQTDGTPLFTVNNHRIANKCVRSKLCGVCGRRLTDAGWFVGGVRSFLDEGGAFIGPANHLECAEYALQVCPFLVARSYKPIEAKKVDQTKIPEGMKLDLLPADFVGTPLPERFGLGLCDGYDFHLRYGGMESICRPRGWKYVEFWKHGAPCEPPPSGEVAPY